MVSSSLKFKFYGVINWCQSQEYHIVTARPNLLYIVRFRPYRPHGFVPGDASPLLSLTLQNAYDKLATITLNKTSYHSLTH
jgi:hypothetical protein